LEEVRHPFSAAMATYYAANVYQFLREPAEVLRLCRMVMEVSDREGFVFHSGIARILAGWAQACLGDDAGFPAAVRAVAEWEATGVAPVQTYCSLLLAEAALRTRRMEEGAAAIEHGLALSRRTGEGAWRAELLRLKGELALTEGEEPAGAEHCFQRALTWAGDHGARSQELRAATSLSRLWLRQKRKDAARDLMQRVYGTFTEGFQTVDLREAAALLARIG
ncbi:MAG TPA: hypothetical protein VL359_12575, partial [bacterium]|nr:hypothetical protein [bacterium]